MTKSRSIPRVVVLEPSKVGPQHITLLQGYLEALLAVGLDARGYQLVYRADPSSHASLELSVSAAVALDPIRVTDPEKRRWIRKGIEEVREVLRTVETLGPDDLLLVTCLTAPALMILEAINHKLPRRQVVVVLHSELEALFDPSIRSPKSWGFWAYRWFRLRRMDSSLGLAVIASYIRDRLETTFPDTFPAGSVRVLPFPIVKVDAKPLPLSVPRVSFVGYKTRFKGFPEFEALARRLHGEGAHAQFVTVGAGQVENASTARAVHSIPRPASWGNLHRLPLQSFLTSRATRSRCQRPPLMPLQPVCACLQPRFHVSRRCSLRSAPIRCSLRPRLTRWRPFCPPQAISKSPRPPAEKGWRELPIRSSVRRRSRRPFAIGLTKPMHEGRTQDDDQDPDPRRLVGRSRV